MSSKSDLSVDGKPSQILLDSYILCILKVKFLMVFLTCFQKKKTGQKHRIFT